MEKENILPSEICLDTTAKYEMIVDSFGLQQEKSTSETMKPLIL